MLGNCIACNECVEPIPIASVDRLTKKTFRLFQCASCQTAWLDAPDDLDTGAYYPEASSGEKGYRFHPVVELVVRLFREARARFVLRFWQGEPGRILDIGCGRGVMLAELATLGWSCVGTEISKGSSGSEENSPKVIVHVQPSLEACGFPSDYFDIVTLWHVLEHLPRPLDVLKEIKRVLKPGGLLVVEVPNFASWQARLNGAKWIYLEAPRHLYQFSSKGLLKILQANSFKKIYSGTLSAELGFFGMFQSLLNLIVPRENLFFSLLNRKERQALDFSDHSVSLGVGALAIFALPCLLAATLLELISVIAGHGGVIRVVARNLK